MHKTTIWLLLFLAFQTTPGAVSGQDKSARADRSPGSPERQGIRSETLDSLLLFLQNTHQNIHHLSIIRNDRMILRTDIYPYSSRHLHDLASVTKSITSLLVGIAIDKGFIRDEHVRVLSFFPEIGRYDRRLDSLRIKDLLTMTSGFACGVIDGEKALSDMRKSGDWVKFIFSLPVTSEPGTKFSYCSCNYYLLGEILARSSRLTPHAFAKKYLFAPLGIQSSKWLANSKGINHGWGDLFLFPSDMAKIGKLVLDKGRWKGRQVIPAPWITKSLRTFSQLPDDKGYGYGWWTNDKVGYYEAAGRGRQTISVIPSRKMVVIMLGGEFDAGTVGSYIFRSIGSDSSLPENKTGLAKLTKRVNDIAKAAAVPAAADTPADLCATIRPLLDGKTILFEKNISSIDSMQLHFLSSTGGSLSFYKGAGKEKYPFALSRERYAISMDPTLQLPVALQAICERNEGAGSSDRPDTGTLILHYNQLCRINNFYFHFKVGEQGITTTLEETSNFIKTPIYSSIR